MIAFWLILSAAAGGLMLYGLHRGCCYLEDRGYMYYRKKRAGTTSGSVFQELDRLTRPSVQHVEQVRDEITARPQRENDGE